MKGLEFHEKLQAFRKSRGLTQEELAQSLYVSRTAISKWESGKGYPSIDSLKAISKFFAVSIDDLLSSEELMTAAKAENDSNIRTICDTLVGAVDLMSIMLWLLPLYPESAGDTVTAANLFSFRALAPSLYGILWILLIVLCVFGTVKLICNWLRIEKGRNFITQASVLCSVVTVVFLIFLRIPYAAAMAFLLLAIKTVLIFKIPRTDK